MEKTGDLGRRLTVQVPAESIDKQVASRLNKLRGQVRLKGFRPGKVPLNVVRQRYGAQVRQEVVQEVMQSSLQDAISEQELRVAGISRIEPGEDGGEEGFRFTADLEVFPELPEIEVSGLKIDRPVVEITEEDVDDMIDTLREQRRSWSDAGRPAADGDRVRVEYVADVDGERVPAAGHQEIAPVLGSGSVFEAFEQALAGMSAGEEKALELTFPEDYREEQLAGRTARVELKVAAVETSKLPEVDDAFAESFGVEGGVEQLRADVRRNLEREMRNARVNRLKRTVTDALAAYFSDFGLPETAVRQEARQMQAQVQRQTGQDQPIPLEHFTEAAERRVRLGYILAEAARRNDIEIDEARVQAKIEEIAETYEQPSEIIEYYRTHDQLMDGVRNAVLEEQVIDWVLDNADVTDRPMSFKELMDQS